MKRRFKDIDFSALDNQGKFVQNTNNEIIYYLVYGLIIIGISFLFPLTVTLIVIVISLAFIFVKGYAVTSYRRKLGKFALSNGFKYFSVHSPFKHEGIIFGIGYHRSFTHFFSGLFHAKPFIIYNYQFQDGNPSQPQAHFFGVMEIRIGKEMPHIFLDGRGNNGLFNDLRLPNTFDKSQYLELEGDFNRHFSLYVAKEYEIMALTLLTPDLMQMLIKSARNYDIEILDGCFVIYSYALTSAKDYKEMFKVADTLLSNFEHNLKTFKFEQNGNENLLKKTKSTRY